MPRKDIDFSKCVIYKIVCNDLNMTDIYVGHTTDFTKRKYMHKLYCNLTSHKSYNSKVYTTIRENGGWDEWSMIEIEKYSCIDSNEARARERYWYELLCATLNSNCPFINDEEKILKAREIAKQNYQKNREKLLQNYQTNREKILQHRKDKTENMKVERQLKYIENVEKHKEYMKEYRIKKADKIKECKTANCEKHKEYMKEYYKNNKTKMFDDRKIQCICDCGGNYFLYNKSKHIKTKKHLNYLA